MSILKGEIVLHDLIQEMGLEIVRQRYWKPQSIMETWGCLSRFKKEQGKSFMFLILLYILHETFIC